MYGILIPLVTAVAGVLLFLLCLVKKRLRKFALAALGAPFAASIILFLGAFILADMNPRSQFGSSYLATGLEHDPAPIDFILWISFGLITLLLVGTLLFLIQKLLTFLASKI